MDTSKKCEIHEKEKTTMQLLVDDFELQNSEIHYQTKEDLRKSETTLLIFYTIDLIICHVLIGSFHRFNMHIKTLSLKKTV